MRIVFLLLDFAIFFAITAFITTVRSATGLWDVLFFVDNCKVMLPVFVLNVILLLIFSFYDLQKSHNKNTNGVAGLFFSFIISFITSAAGIYFGSILFNTTTPRTSLLLILLIFYVYVFLSRELYSGLHFSQINIITLGNSRTLKRIRKTLSPMPQYKIVYNLNNISEIPEKLDIIDLDFVLVSNKLLEQDQNTANIIFDKFVSKGVICLTDLDFFETLFLRIPKETLKNITWLIKDVNLKPKYFIYDAIKRFFDILFSICLVPIFLPIGIFIYLLILVIDRQKPLFFQERIGMEGRIIQICKFRTMVSGTEKPTKLGKILRKFRLDEIPQLVNILDGSISIVGPRPLQYEDNELLNKYVPAHKLRSIVKPGLTGWAQLNFKAPCNYSVEQIPAFESEDEKNKYFNDAFVRLAYDVWYIKHFSFSLDIEIILKTAKRAFVKDKRLSE